jgi:RNA polymerase sigma-70 factor (ECF subfamily)
MASHPAASLTSLDDLVLAGHIARGDHAAFEVLMRRHNGRLFRLARAVLRDDAEAEDALQEAYLDAYRHMADFRGASQVGTWLGRIVVNRALMRLRRRRRDRIVVPFTSLTAPAPDAEPEVADPGAGDETLQSPPGLVLRGELRRLLERRIDDLPMAFRTVFVMRDVEDMSVQETAECLAIPTATVRTRLFRARALLREALARDVDAATAGVFGFAGERCDRIVAGVLAALRAAGDSGAARDEVSRAGGT